MNAPHSPPNPPAAARARQHPLLIVAALAVILFCLIATAAVLGWIPSPLGNGANRQLSESDRLALSSKMEQQGNAGAVVTPLAPAPAPQAYAALPAPASNYNDVPAPAVQAAPVRDTLPPVRDSGAAPVRVVESAPARNWCDNCGNIESIRQISTRAQGSGVGAGAGAILGGLLGNQVGGGHGRQLATVAGAVGGAVVGNQVEGNMNAHHSYEIRVRLDSGKYRTFHQQSAPGWRDGDRVRIVNGHLRAVG